MPSDTEIRASISEALNGLATAPILDASRRVFETLGYKSERRPSFPDSKPATFIENFDGQRSFNAERGMLGAWKSADFISQVTDEEIQLARKNQPSLLDDAKIEKGNARSFAFLSIGLNEGGQLGKGHLESNQSTRRNHGATECGGIHSLPPFVTAITGIF